MLLMSTHNMFSFRNKKTIYLATLFIWSYENQLKAHLTGLDPEGLKTGGGGGGGGGGHWLAARGEEYKRGFPS